MGLFNSAAKAAREAFELRQARAIDLFGEGEDVYHWLKKKNLDEKMQTGFSPFTHVGTKKAARDLFLNRMDPDGPRYSSRPSARENAYGATIPLRFNRKKTVLDINKDIGDHSALGVMWQVAPHIYGNRETAIDAPLVKRTLDRVVNGMSPNDVDAVANELQWAGYGTRPPTKAPRDWVRRKLRDANDPTASGAVLKYTSREGDMAGREMLAHELGKFNIGALKYTNDVEDAGSKSYMIVQPHDIRSPNADFDWEQWMLQNRNIMAAVPAVAAGGGLLAMSKRDKREREAA
jgi:hypothetical protein